MQDDIEYPELPPQPLMSGSEPIEGGGLGQGGTMLGYWRWAHSDLSANAERGVFAEYLVRLALGLDDRASEAWAAYDVLWQPQGRAPIRIEVKTSAFVQVWAQRALSRPVFGIRETQAWDPATGTYAGEARRQADVYVFCLETYRGHGRPDPTDLDEWEFYVVPTRALDGRGHQKTITLAQITGELGAEPCRAGELAERIIEAVGTAS